MNRVEENIIRLKEDVSRICQKLGRDSAEVTIVAVTKLASRELIQQALDVGITHIGENKVQEALKKYQDLKGSSISLKRHMIGHLQTNKVKQSLKIFDLLQSVDSLRLAQELEQQLQVLNRKIDILIQVNTSGEKQKFGVAKSQALRFIQEVSPLKNLKVVGLMTMAPLTEDAKILGQCFRDLRELNNKVQRTFEGSPNIHMKFLSMGMSGDYRIAIQEGSNMIRIGSAIFSTQHGGTNA